MKTNLLKQYRPNGSALVAAIILTVTVALFAAASLKLITHEYRFSKTSSVWSQTLHTSEAGIEVAMEEFHKQALYRNGWSGWTLISSNTYAVSNVSMSLASGSASGSRYTIIANTSTAAPSITSIGLQNIPALNDDQVSRAVKVMLSPIMWYPFQYSMLGKGQVTISGNSSIDSFHSGDPSKSTNGQYDPAKSSTNADVSSMGSISNAIVGTGSGSLHGDLIVSENGNISLGGSFSYSGTSRNDLDVDIPDVVVPFSTTTSDPAINGNTTINVSGSKDMSVPGITLNGNKTLTISGSGTIRIYVSGDITGDVPGDTSFSGNSSVIMTPIPSNALLKVEIYANGNVLLNNVINTPGNAANLTIKGTKLCKSVHFTGNDDFIGTIYAPQADVLLTGNGDFMGAIVGNTIDNRGTANFHYDEALATNSTPIVVGYEIVSWREIQP